MIWISSLYSGALSLLRFDFFFGLDSCFLSSLKIYGSVLESSMLNVQVSVGNLEHVLVYKERTA